jgi:hypothetical protein
MLGSDREAVLEGDLYFDTSSVIPLKNHWSIMSWKNALSQRGKVLSIDGTFSFVMIDLITNNYSTKIDARDNQAVVVQGRYSTWVSSKTNATNDRHTEPPSELRFADLWA